MLSPGSSGRLDEAVDDLLAAGLLEGDVELVALDQLDLPVAELVVEDPVADLEWRRSCPPAALQDLGPALDQLAASARRERNRRSGGP